MNLIDRLREVIKELEDHRIGPNVSRSSIFHDCLHELERLHADNQRLREALRGTLSWLSSYPGGGAENCWERTRALLVRLGEIE